MMRRVSVLALALIIAACGDDGPSVARPDQLALQIVRGDRQVARVADAPASQSVAGYSPAATLPDNILPEPLVARIVIDGQPPSAALSPGDPLGPSFAVLPPSTAVTFRVIQPDDPKGRHCGTSFLDSGVPDDSGYVTTFWERGTYAGECRMEVRLVVDATPRIDTVFVATFTPGPPATFGGISYSAIAGDTVRLYQPDQEGTWIADRYGNEMTWQYAVANYTPEWQLLDTDLRESIAGPVWECSTRVLASGTGWTFPAPPERFPQEYCIAVSFGGRHIGRFPLLVWPAD